MYVVFLVFVTWHKVVCDLISIKVNCLKNGAVDGLGTYNFESISQSIYF